AVLALGGILEGAGAVVLSLANLATSHHLVTAGGWVDVAGLAVALAAVAMVGWGMVVARRRALALELGGAAAATFLLVLGALVTVATSGSTAGDVLTALGFGAWAALLVVVAARTSIAERSPLAPPPGAATAWLVAAGGLVLLAVGSGLPAPGRSDSTTGVVAACLGAVGLAVLVGVLVASRARHLLASRTVATTVAGLSALAAHEVALAVYAAVSFTPTSTLGDVRSTVATAAFVGALAWVVLGLAAWQRIPEVPAWPLAVPPLPAAPPPHPAAPPFPGAQPPTRCPACGAPAGPRAGYCWQCGTALGVPPTG
ncbi:MAG: hypothetical protein ACRDZR_17770, partial [Acidimicrobiales bacterium]